MKKENDLSIFTVCNIAYLHKALVLADSVYNYTGFKTNIYIFDKKRSLNLIDEHCTIHWVEDLNIPNYLHLAFRYDIIEFSTSLKPFISLHLLEKFSKVIFFDPDILVYSSITSIVEDLNTNSILLTPHYTTPQSDDITESDTGMLRFGSFNLGFYGIRKSKQSVDFLSWWSKRCIDLCYMESQFGLSTDQKWVSIAPCFYDDIKISFNRGYNAAPWNSFERSFSWNFDGSIDVNNEFRLVFFHFSNFDHKDPGYMNARSLLEKGKFREDLEKLGRDYSQLLKMKSSKYSDHLSVLYAYNFMSDGNYISPILRHAYSSVYDSFKHVSDPFDSQGLVGKFAKNNYLISKKLKPIGYLKNNLNHKETYTFEIKIMNIILRQLLIVFGPNRFHVFSRSLVFFSSPRLNKGLWKF